MTWETIFYLSILGAVVTVGPIALTAMMGIRYRRELPKLPIVRSIEALELERENLESRISELSDELAEARNTVKKGEEWSSWMEDKKEEIEQLKEDHRHWDEQHRKLEEMRNDCREVEELARNLTRELGDKQTELAQVEARARELESRIPELEAMRAEHEKLARLVPGLREEHENLSSRNEELSREVEERQTRIVELRQEEAELSGTVQALREDEDRLLEAIAGLQKTHTQAGGIPEGHDPCEELWQSYFAVRRDSGGSVDEAQRLREMMQALDHAGIRLPKRTLYAFHTALKIQDISPLTVLAGVSGTGKSLLPTIYAKCMGMHFLNLPTQPSWNSPQDLFGFYNYMEHRYKATPLAQALLQFAPFDRPEPVSPILEDQVLLVLLDEMNLARIEYYFSELLSRLELRRSIDPCDEEERRQVEIPLEIGEGGEKKGPGVRIYPGENVLFTGTMNEDESTLSLSDKVLDRATVLRFGRPTQLLTKQPDTSRLEESEPLALEVWRQWQSLNERENSLPEPLEELIGDRLAGIMAALGVPLGHRGAQGIARYMLLYPGRGEEMFRHALCDQIEQKVLPKVRGKEIAAIGGPMDDLVKLAEELRDEQLAHAIRNGLDDDQGVFLWNGLDRIEE